jgi:NADH-quinone oxidoreductase subunit M
MLVGLIYLYLQTPGNHTFDLHAFYNLTLSAQEQGFIFWALFLAFAVKIPIFPLHTWQPDTYTDAPAQGTMLLSGIMLKMGIYGLIRWMIPVVPAGMEQWGGLAITLCVIGIIYASCMAIVQKDYKRLIAYSSVAHVGLIAAGVLVLNAEGLQGAMFQMLSHGVNVIGLFAIIDIIQRRMKTRNLDELGGLANNSPLFTVLFMIIVLGAVALPLTNGFVGEFLLLNGVFQFNAVMGGVAGLTIILGAVYMFRSYQKIMLGNANGNTVEFTGLLLNEKIVLISVAALVIITGVYPKPILNVAQPVLEEILIHAKAHI